MTSRSGPECQLHTLKLEIVRRLGAALTQLNVSENNAETPRETSQQVTYSAPITLRIRVSARICAQV